MNILIVNLHSSKNLGDEAILRSTISLISIKYPNSQVTLVANDPDSWDGFNQHKVLPSFIRLTIDNINKFSFNTIKIFWLIINLILSFSGLSKKMSNNFSETIRSIKDAELVLSCGGGNFYSNSFLGVPLFLNCLIIIFAGLNKKKIIFLPQSFGPIKKNFHKLYIKKALTFADKILVREKKSIEFLNSINVRSEKIILVPDLAMNMTRILRTGLQEQKNINPDRIRIGLTIMNRANQDKSFTNQFEYEESIEVCLLDCLSKRQIDIFLFVQCFGPSNDQDDTLVTRKIYNKLKTITQNVYIKENFKNSIELTKELATMDIIIATRMHTAIFGLINCIPTITIGYQHKAQGLMELFNLNTLFILINEVNPNNLEFAFQHALRNRNEIIEKLGILIPDIQAQIQEEILRIL